MTTIRKPHSKLVARLSTFLVSVLVLSAGRATAQGSFDIFNNYQEPGDGFNHSQAYEVDDYTDPEDGPFYLSVAIPFTTGAGSNVVVTSLTLALQQATAPNFDVIISLREDNAGTPGTVIENISGTVNSPTPALKTFNSALNPVLTGGTTYWIRAEADTESQVFWYLSGNGGGTSAYSYNGTTWANQGISPSLKIEGITPVPEPAIMALSGIGLALLWALRRKENHRS